LPPEAVKKRDPDSITALAQRTTEMSVLGVDEGGGPHLPQ